MTGTEIIDQVMAAPEAERKAVAKRLLKEYTEPDKELIEPWVYEAIAVEDTDDFWS